MESDATQGECPVRAAALTLEDTTLKPDEGVLSLLRKLTILTSPEVLPPSAAPPVVSTNTAQIDVTTTQSQNQEPPVVASHTAQNDVAQGDTLCPSGVEFRQKITLDELDMQTKLAGLKLRLAKRQ